MLPRLLKANWMKMNSKSGLNLLLEKEKWRSLIKSYYHQPRSGKELKVY